MNNNNSPRAVRSRCQVQDLDSFQCNQTSSTTNNAVATSLIIQDENLLNLSPRLQLAATVVICCALVYAIHNIAADRVSNKISSRV